MMRLRMLKRSLLAIVVSLVFMVSVNALSYNTTGTKTVWTSLCSVTVNCTGVYYVDGNTRWFVYGNCYGPVLYPYVSFTKTIPYDSRCEVTAHVSVTDSSYQYATGTGYFTYKYHASTHSVSVE